MTTPPRSRVSGDHLKKYDPRTQSEAEAEELSVGARAEGLGRTALMRRMIGLFGGVGLALLVYLVMPGDREVWPRLTAATAVLMAVWWMTEAIPIPATALLPLIIFPLLVPAGDFGSAEEAITCSTVSRACRLRRLVRSQPSMSRPCTQLTVWPVA